MYYGIVKIANWIPMPTSITCTWMGFFLLFSKLFANKPLNFSHKSFSKTIVLCSVQLLLLTYTTNTNNEKEIKTIALTLSAHLGRLFVFVVSFLVTSLFPTNDLKRYQMLQYLSYMYYKEPTKL